VSEREHGSSAFPLNLLLALIALGAGIAAVVVVGLLAASTIV